VERAARWGQRAQVVAANWKQPVADLDFEKSENWKIRGHTLWGNEIS
jgi:hypothetical protein